MAASAVLVGSGAGNAVASLDNFESLSITPHLGDAAEARITLDAEDPAVGQLLIGFRAVRIYLDGELEFYGKVWEPLELTADTVTIVAKDPYAEFGRRRVRVDESYTSQDAGLIAYDRVTTQNLLWPTFLGEGTRQASTNRVRDYKEGKLEGEIIQELAEAAGGFFWKVRPVEGTAGVMGLLDILYPDAGTSRLDVRFEYGDGTLANVDSYMGTQFLPTNRYTVASSNAAGGRISVFAQSAASVLLYGLFEDATTYSDVDDVALLTAQAQSQIRDNPPFSFAIQPSMEAPVMLRDFTIGDFVRLRIKHGAFDLTTWVRVVEGTYEIGADGVERTSAVVLETIEGGRVIQNPARIFRDQLDEQRRRLEALERKVEEIDVTPVSPDVPDDGGGGDGPGGDPPDEPDPPEGPPGGTPQAPTISSVAASGINSLGEGRYIVVTVNCDAKDTQATLSVTVRPDSGASSLNTKTASLPVSGGQQTQEFRFRNEPSGSVPSGPGLATAQITNSAGIDLDEDGYVVPAIPLD